MRHLYYQLDYQLHLRMLTTSQMAILTKITGTSKSLRREPRYLGCLAAEPPEKNKRRKIQGEQLFPLFKDIWPISI